MTELNLIRAQQAEYGEWLRTNAHWRDSDEMTDVPGYGRMRKGTAYSGYLLGAEDAIKDEVLLRREMEGGRP